MTPAGERSVSTFHGLVFCYRRVRPLTSVCDHLSNDQTNLLAASQLTNKGGKKLKQKQDKAVRGISLSAFLFPFFHPWDFSCFRWFDIPVRDNNPSLAVHDISHTIVIFLPARRRPRPRLHLPAALIPDGNH